MKHLFKGLLFSLAIILSSCGRAPSQETGRFKSYDSLKSYASSLQKQFKKDYTAANDAGKARIIKTARDSVFSLITKEYFSFWFGTPWSFYGATQTPRDSSIACGYFVTTVLEDAGFNIPRIKWAQMASEPVIKIMTKEIKRFSGRPLKEVEDHIIKSGTGLYVVGLDNHVGFIYNDGEKIRFVHSNYYVPKEGVMAQTLDSHNPLKNSRYRVVGKILGDEMMKNWILGKRIE